MEFIRLARQDSVYVRFIHPSWDFSRHCLYVLINNEMHNSCNQFLHSTVFCLLYMFRTNLVVHYQEHRIIYCITQYNRYNRAGQSS